jgi:hypothetical protein
LIGGTNLQTIFNALNGPWFMGFVTKGYAPRGWPRPDDPLVLRGRLSTLEAEEDLLGLRGSSHEVSLVSNFF